jgi:hypothetical protein
MGVFKALVMGAFTPVAKFAKLSVPCAKRVVAAQIMPKKTKGIFIFTIVVKD